MPCMQTLSNQCLLRYEDAVASFTKCIALDTENEVYYSNRAAAFTALQRFAEALADGKRAVALKPRWAKGWARIGAAYSGLEEHAEVRVCDLDGTQRW